MKKITVIIIGFTVLLLGITGTTTMAENNNLPELTGLMDKLPTHLEGWQKSGKGAVYAPENLFKYINGGAELYISYKFRHVAARTYHKEGLPEVKVDIFDMGSSLNAYGIFSHSRETEDRFVAGDVESEYASGLLTFWKNRYYVSILAYPETAEKKILVQKLAQHLAGSITGTSTKPAIIGLLPPENLAPHTIRYFRNHVWLNSHLYVSDKNILHIDDNTEAVLAKYHVNEKGRGGTSLLMVTYPDAKKAADAYQNFLKLYMQGHTDGFKEVKQRWTACNIYGNIVAVVFKAPAKAQAGELLANVKKSIDQGRQ